MEYLSHIYWIILVVWLVEFYFFGMQRATIKISREGEVDWKLLGVKLLPPWYSVVWFFRITKWFLLTLIIWFLNWKIGLAILITMFVLSIITPIPYKLLYSKLFLHRIDQLYLENPETASLLLELLNVADFIENER